VGSSRARAPLERFGARRVLGMSVSRPSGSVIVANACAVRTRCRTGVRAGEIVRRVTGRTLSAFLAEAGTGPLDLDCYVRGPEAALGLPHGRTRRRGPADGLAGPRAGRFVAASQTRTPDPPLLLRQRRHRLGTPSTTRTHTRWGARPWTASPPPTP